MAGARLARFSVSGRATLADVRSRDERGRDRYVKIFERRSTFVPSKAVCRIRLVRRGNVSGSTSQAAGKVLIRWRLRPPKSDRHVRPS